MPSNPHAAADEHNRRRGLANAASYNLQLSASSFLFVFWITFPLLLAIRLIDEFVPRLAGLFETLAQEGAPSLLTKTIAPAIQTLNELVPLVGSLGELLAPLMGLMGLPGEAGAGWAAAILVQQLAGYALIAENWGQLQLTTAQATIFAVLVLQVHSILIEVRLAQRLGVRIWVSVALRLGTALALGILLHYVYLAMNWLQEPAVLLLVGSAGEAETWPGWLAGQARTWGVFFAVIYALNLMIFYLRAWGIEQAFVFLLRPLMRVLGIHHSAAMMTLIGLILGLTFGAALLLAELRTGRISRRDMFLTVSTLGICHSLLEDTLLTLLFGAHLSGVLLARVVFSITVIAVLSRLFDCLPARLAERWFMIPAKACG